MGGPALSDRSNLEEMPRIRDDVDGEPVISIPEEDLCKSDSETSQNGETDHDKEREESPEGEWIGLDPTLGESGRKLWIFVLRTLKLSGLTGSINRTLLA